MKGMSDSEIQRYIRQEVQRHLNILLPGVSQNATRDAEDISNMYPGMNPISARPVVRPYGLVSRAPKGTAQVTGRMGAHPANRMVIGHRDANAPTPPDEGDAILYHKLLSQVQALKDKIVLLRQGGNSFTVDDNGQQVVANGFGTSVGSAGLTGGKTGDFETFVAGETLVQCLEALVDVLVSHTHITGGPGAPTSPPIQASQLTQVKSEFLSNAKILMKTGGRY